MKNSKRLRIIEHFIGSKNLILFLHFPINFIPEKHDNVFVNSHFTGTNACCRLNSPLIEKVPDYKKLPIVVCTFAR